MLLKPQVGHNHFWFFLPMHLTKVLSRKLVELVALSVSEGNISTKAYLFTSQHCFVNTLLGNPSHDRSDIEFAHRNSSDLFIGYHTIDMIFFVLTPQITLFCLLFTKTQTILEHLRKICAKSLTKPYVSLRLTLKEVYCIHRVTILWDLY